MFIVENLNIIYTDINSIKGTIETKIGMKKSKIFFLNFFFFLSHTMAPDMRQKLWIFILTTCLDLEKDRAIV